MLLLCNFSKYILFFFLLLLYLWLVSVYMCLQTVLSTLNVYANNIVWPFLGGHMTLMHVSIGSEDEKYCNNNELWKGTIQEYFFKKI